MPVAALLVFVYALWFFTGASQRVRHLLPVYPLLLILGTVAVARWLRDGGPRVPVAAALAVTLALQVAIQGLYALPFVRFLASGEGREAFLARSVPQYPVVASINRLLTGEDRLATSQRQLLYFIKPPTLLLHEVAEAVVDITANDRDVGRFVEQLHAQKITHLLHVTVPGDATPPVSGLVYLTEALMDAGCAHAIDEQTTTVSVSRTLGLGSSERRAALLAIDYDRCPLYRAGRQ
jgi:hypothetical protein